MLQNIRDNIQGTAAKVIIALMIVPFALYGIDFFFGGQTETEVATVNGEKITERELQRAIALQRRQMLAMMGDQLDPALLDESVLRKPALGSLIRQKVLLQNADDLGLTITRQQTNKAIAAMPQFQEDGRFSQQRYQQVLRAQGFDSALFRELLSTEMLIGQLSAAIAETAFLSDYQKQQVVELGGQKRTYHYIRVPVERYLDEVTVEQADIEAYYQQNKQRFQTEEKVKLAYLDLREQAFYEPVEEEVIRAEYERRLKAAEEQAEREVAHILVETGPDRNREQALERIREAQQKLASGASFAELAGTYSDDVGSAEQGGALGFTRGDTFPPAFERAVAELEVGDVSDVVETDAGLHLVKLLSIRKPEVPDYEAARAEIETDIQSQRAKPKLVSAVERLRDLVFNAPDLAGPAREMGLEVKTTDWLSESDAQGLLAFPEIKQVAFSDQFRESGHNSEVFELTPKRYAVVRIAEHREPEPKPLEAVRDRIVGTLQRERAAEKAEQRLQEIAEALRSGKDPESVAGEAGLEWQVAVRSGRQDSAVPEAVRRKAFSLPRPDDSKGVVSGSVIEDNGDRVAIRLDAVFDGDRDMIGAQRLRELYASALRAQANQAFGAYYSGVQNRAKVSVNQ